MGTKDICKKLNRMSYPKRIAIGYLFIIVLGTVLLSLPAASNDSQSIGFLGALFTSTSASCVTGLIVADTYTQWSLFGRIVILCLIQIGGLGFMSFAAMFALFFHKRIGLGMRDMLKESINTFSIGGIVELFKLILKGTLLFEGTGAVILSIRFLKYFPPLKAIGYGIFHAVSSFCNAGFDLAGCIEPNASFSVFNNDPVICLTLCFLVIIGGIGFLVWEDVRKNGIHFKSYLLHSKIALSMTTILLVAGTGIYLIMEYNNTLEGMGLIQKILVSFYQSVTPRTAGFSFTDTVAMAPSTKLFTMFLMFVGGSSGSTAGGAKVTTVAVILISTITSLTGRKTDEIFGRRLEADAVRRATFVITIDFSLAFIAALVISAVDSTLPIIDIMFETVSAIGTVGITANVTPYLSRLSRYIIIILMYCGRVGSTSFTMLFMDRKPQPSVTRPEEKINIG